MTRARPRTKTPRTAFGKHIGAVDASVDKLMERMLYMIPNELTFGDLAELFVSKEWRLFSIEASKTFNIGNRYNCPQIKWCLPDEARWLRVGFACESNEHPILPKIAFVQEDASALIKDKVTTWIGLRHKIGKDFGRLKAVISALNEACPTPAHVRFFLPGVLTLCSMNPTLTTIGNEIQTFVEPNKIPTLPAELRRACRQAGATIALSQLLDDPKDRKEDVTLQLENVVVRDDTGFQYTTV
jgi:hypothetical protein